ncbi:MAG: long-chain fatty acid--CoA ligase, partial [Phycisphaerales bacterium]|nr:long-chain fatty acid--CoA ligase [Phycisphaerales bacterium]
TGEGELILSSSGTTGRSKLVRRDVGALMAVGHQVRQATGLGTSDRVLLPVALGHSYGIDMLFGTLVSGAALEIGQGLHPVELLRRARDATILPAVPFLIEAFASLEPPRTGRLRLVFSAGAPLPEQVRSRFESRWGLGVGDLYGATELGTVAFRSPSEAPGHVGWALDGVRLEILDPESDEATSGQEGEVAIEAPSMFRGYLGEGDHPGGPWRTGDLGRIDPSGALHLTGRLKFVIECGGIKVNPMEIEAVLTSHPRVREAIVVPLRVSETVNRLQAFVVSNDDVGSKDLESFMRTRLAMVKVPRRFTFVESLPKTPGGKVLRSAFSEVTV